MKLFYRMGDAMFHRLGKPWFHNDFLFQYSSLGREQKKNLSILHGMTKSVIKKRREDLKKVPLRQDEVPDEEIGNLNSYISNK